MNCIIVIPPVYNCIQVSCSEDIQIVVCISLMTENEIGRNMS